MFDWFKKRKAPPLPPFPYPLQTVPGGDAFATFEQLLHAGQGVPIILGPDDDLRMLAETIAMSGKEGHTPDSILRKAATTRFPEDLRAEQAAETARMNRDHPEWAEENDEPHMGEWPATPPRVKVKGPGVPFGAITGLPHARVHIALIPTKDRTEIPAYLHWGGWNACPHPHHHVAAARHWRDKYGAELISLSHDIAEFRLKRRPKDQTEAMALAREHFDYCSEIEELAPYGAELLVIDWWQFWWD